MLYTSLALVAASFASAGTLRPRADPPFQDIPTTAQADNTFNNGKSLLAALPPYQSGLPIPDVYGARSIDLPFNRLYHGNMKFFSKGQLNSPDRTSDQWIDQPGVVDSAKQSACGIPDNAFSISKVAIHPYFLKYAPLDRYCMQDVCISFWNGKTGPEQSDMMLKVTDICSTDPSDPTHCKTPGDIKVDRTKVWIMEHLTDRPVENHPSLTGNEFTDGESWWFFTKCWADGLVQPAYTDNWFAQPPLPNNLGWSQDTARKQWEANNRSYPLHNPAHPTFPNGAYNPDYTETTSPPITDWSPSDPDPEWCPVAGGKGWGNPTGSNCGGSQQVKLASSAPSSTSKVASTFGSPATSTFTTENAPSTSQAATSSPSPVQSQGSAVTSPSSDTSVTSTSSPASSSNVPPSTSSSESSTSSSPSPSQSQASAIATPFSNTTMPSTSTSTSASPSIVLPSEPSSGNTEAGGVSPKKGAQTVTDDDGDEECDLEDKKPEEETEPVSTEEDEDCDAEDEIESAEPEKKDPAKEKPQKEPEPVLPEEEEEDECEW